MSKHTPGGDVMIDVLIFVAVLGMSLYLSKGGKKP
jgi:hypothetical protein